jgi:hypothetical protein
MVWGAVFAWLSTTVGLGFKIMALIGAAIAGIWSASGIYLGRVFNRRENRTGAPEEPPADKNPAAT